MKLADISHGPDWVIWVAFFIVAALSILLILGHGSWLIAGYNTASKEQKEKYNAKKLCRTTGIGMAIIAALIFVMGWLEDVLPVNFIYLALGIIVADCLGMMIAGNTICRK